MVTLRLNYTTHVFFEPSTPRIYTDFTTFDDQTYELKFESRLVPVASDPERNLLFLATSTGLSHKLLVKLVSDDQYGVDVHRKLAGAGLAPPLFGVARKDGAPTAYVMEYLSPDDNWDTLHQYVKDYPDESSRIYEPLSRMIDIMEKENIVHGDLRPNNILIRDPDGTEEPELKIIDFDWAGVGGEVRYPQRRNENIPWPAGPGERILTGHDRSLLMATLG